MVDEIVKDKDQLLVELKAALDTGDFKAVAKVSREIDKIQVGEEKLERDAKLAELTGLTVKVGAAISKVINKMVDADELDAADGVWYSMDFGQVMVDGVRPSNCRLIKAVAKKGGGAGTGAGKKFSVSTTELLAQHGTEQMGDSGMTFQEAYDADTSGNSRYKVRIKLLRVAGIS